MFTVDRIEYTGNGEFMIAGRNCAETPLRKAHPLLLAKDGGLTGVELEIVRIDFYGRDVDEVDPGHTAALFFRKGPESSISLGDTLVYAASGAAS